MRLTALIAGLMASTVFAAPIQSSSQSASKTLIHPAVSSLTDCTEALTNVVTGIRAFDGKSEWDARRLEINAINAINILNNATNLILTQPDIDYLTALQFIPVAPGLFAGAYSLVNALSEKKAVLQSTPDLARRTLNVLEATSTGVQGLVAAFNQKLPSAVSLVLSGIDNDVVKKIQDTRDQYKFMGPVAPVVAAGPAIQAPSESAYPSYPAYGQAQQQQQSQPQYQPQYQPYSQPAWSNTQSQPQFQPSSPTYQPAGIAPY